MADKRHRSGAYDSSKPKRYRSDPSRGSSASDPSLTHPPTSARRSSPIDFTNSSNSSMDPDQYHQFPVPSQAPFSADPSCPSSPPGVSAPQMDLNYRDHSSQYVKQWWCYTTGSPEPIDYGSPGDENDLTASIYVFPPDSKRPTLVEDKHTEKEMTRGGRKRRSRTNNPDTVPAIEVDPRGYLMSQGAMDGEGHMLYENFFDIPVSQGPQPPYQYPQTLHPEDFDSPEPNDRPENIDAVADRRAGWSNQTQAADQTQEAGQTQEEDGWDIVEGPYPEPDGCENDQGRFTAQEHYQGGAASWFHSLSRH